MTTTATVPDAVSSPVWVRFGQPEKQSRLTIFFRIILLIPQYIVVYFLQLALFFAAIFAWFAALVTGKVPESLAFFMTGVIRWATRVQAYGLFLTGHYPPFALEAKPEYPVDIAVQSGPLNRLAVLFRIILVIPAAIVVTLLGYGLGVFAIILWIVALVVGELPESLFGGVSAVIRFQARVSAYFVMLTSYYPDRLMGDATPAAAAATAAPAAADGPGAEIGGEQAAPTAAPAASPWEMVLTQGAKVLVVILIVLGLGAFGTYIAVRAFASNTTNALGAIATGVDKTLTLEKLNGANTAFNSASSTFSSSVQSCGTNQTCLEGAVTTYATALSHYAQSLESLDVPTSAVAAQQEAVQAARQAEAQMTALSTASGADFAQVANSSSFESALAAVPTKGNALGTAIANGS